MYCPNCGFAVSYLLAVCPRCRAALPPPPGAVLAQAAHAPSLAFANPATPAGFQPLGGVALAVMTAAVVQLVLVLGWLTIYAVISGRVLTTIGTAKYQGVGDVPFSDGERVVSGLFGLGILSVGLVGWGLFVWWLYRARRNIDAIGATSAEWPSGWTVGAWFIPLANLVLVPMVLADVARGSAGTDPDEASQLAGKAWKAWIATAASAILVPVLTLVGFFLGGLLSRTVASPLVGLALGWLPVLILIIWCVLLWVRLVGSVSRAQHEAVGPARSFAQAAG